MNEENHIEVNDIENNIVDSSSTDTKTYEIIPLTIEEKIKQSMEESIKQDIKIFNNRINRFFEIMYDKLNISTEQITKVLGKYADNDKMTYTKVNPLYEYVPFDFTIFNYSEEELSAKINYVKKIDSKKKNTIDFIQLFNYSNSWINKIVYYWIGLTNNLIHKRRYLEYSEKLVGLETRLKNIQKNFESQEIITDNLIKDFFSDLYDCYRSLDVFFEDFIKFMCNSRAPIGEFFVDYQLIKDSVFNKCPVMKNELFLKTISHIEVKKYADYNETDQTIQFCKSNFPEEFKQLEDRLEHHNKEDEYYIEKEKFLFLMRGLLINISKQDSNDIKPNIVYGLVRYADRSDMLLSTITFLFVLNKLCKKEESNINEKNNYKKKIDNIVTNFRKEELGWLNKEEIEGRRVGYNETESTKEQLNSILSELKNVVNSPEEEDECCIDYGYKDVTKTFNKYISKLYYWKRYNIKIINDIQDIIILLFDRYYNLSEDTEKLLCSIKKYMDDFLVIENTFKERIFEHCKDNITDFNTPNCFSEKEIWWFYCVNNYKNKITWKNNPIRDFSYYNNYIRNDKNVKRLPYPLSNDVNWDEIGMDVDRLEYSKRHHYFVNECLAIISNKNFSFKVGDKIESNYKNTGKWNIATITNIDENEKYDIEYEDGEKETNIEIDSIRSLEEIKIINLMRSINQQKDDLKELEKKELLQNRIIKTNDVILQLKKMGEFMKEGVLINDQLFFKFILFTINFLIFLGQYFWNNHIEPEL